MATSAALVPDLGLSDIDRLLDELATGRLNESQPFPVAGGSVPPSRMGPSSQHRLSLLLPALNEEGGLQTVMRKIPRTQLRRLGFDLMVQLLDGGSTDRTREFALEHGAEVYVQKGWGKGSAFREFIPTLRSDYCVIMDSDATYPPQQIPSFAEALRKGAPVLLGSRFKGTIHDGAMTAANKLGNRMLSRFASLLYGQPVSDVCSGMWGFRTEVLKSFTLDADGFDLEANMYTECVRHGIPILEVPIPYHPRIGSAKLRVRTGLRIAWRLFLNRIRAAQ